MELTQELLEAIQKGNREKVAAILDQDRTQVAARGPNGASAILLAVYYGHSELANVFVEHGAELDFFEACAMGKRDRAMELLEQDPSLARAYSADGYHGFGLAIFFGHPELAEVLLARGADVNGVSRNGQNVAPLHAAVARQNAKMVALLLFKGAQANARQQGGFTPLHEAAAHGDSEIARLLIEHGADPLLRTGDGKTAGDLARERGHGELAAWLTGQEPAGPKGG